LTAPSLLRIESKWFCTVRGLIARWDLRVLEDPQLDARAATPLWLAREPVSTRSTSHAWDLREIDELAVWTRAGGRLFHDGERVLLMDPRCRRAAICASPRALAHLRMLQARDGVLAGASQREIAIGLEHVGLPDGGDPMLERALDLHPDVARPELDRHNPLGLSKREEWIRHQVLCILHGHVAGKGTKQLKLTAIEIGRCIGCHAGSAITSRARRGSRGPTSSRRRELLPTLKI